MFKLRKYEFIDHPILGNLKLDFCTPDGQAADTVIIAGENGTGKSIILNQLYAFCSGQSSANAHIEIEDSGTIISLEPAMIKQGIFPPKYEFRYRDKDGCLLQRQNVEHKAILAAPTISFNHKAIKSITTTDLDTHSSGNVFDENSANEIDQLFVDIQAKDDAAIAQYVKNNPDVPWKAMHLDLRMSRFSEAFKMIFNNLAFDRIESKNGSKSILFKKYGQDVPVRSLSSGEQQIVYRGCFMLKDANALTGAAVFLDEPEASLHPRWQEKILDFYKNIFSNQDGIQTSQIFVVTHSPFIIHNKNRKKDKVIVLSRGEVGNLIVQDKPEYYKCTSQEAVEDAFFIRGFTADQPTVYVEGQTDEKYFTRALEVFDLKVPFRFKWIGYLDEHGQERNTGETSVGKAFDFLVTQNLPTINICLKDSDTNCKTRKQNNAIMTAVPKYENTKGMKKGIENALVLDDIDLSEFYTERLTTGDYGEEKRIQEFNKMKCCDTICAMDDETLKVVFQHLREVIEDLKESYEQSILQQR